MEARFSDYVRGYVRIRITGNSYDRFLNLCAYHEIRLWKLLPAGESYEAFITRKDFKRLKAIVRKSHASVAIRERHGLPFFVHKYRKRKSYVIAICVSLLFMLWLSSHVWSITIDGNVSQTDDVIFEYLDHIGISHGMWKAGVDCAELAAGIRSYFTQFSWVTAELNGTRLEIHVREGILSDEDPSGEAQPSSLKASAAGTVVSVFIRKGTAAVAVGDEVEKGDLLVSGAVPVYNDDGVISSWQYVSADADVVIQTELQYKDTLSLSAVVKSYTGGQKTAWLLRIGSLSFSLPVSFEAYEQYSLLTEITQLRIAENFYLPIYLQKFTAKEYDNVEIIYTKEDAENILQSNLQYFMRNLEEKGVQIFKNDVKIDYGEKAATAAGIITIRENAVAYTAIDDTEEDLPDDEYG